MLHAQSIKVSTGTDDEDGILVFDGERLVAVLVRLADESHAPDLAGKWNVEARFDEPSCGESPIFADVSGAMDWLERAAAHAA